VLACFSAAKLLSALSNLLSPMPDDDYVPVAAGIPNLLLNKPTRPLVKFLVRVPFLLALPELTVDDWRLSKPSLSFLFSSSYFLIYS